MRGKKRKQEKRKTLWGIITIKNQDRRDVVPVRNLEWDQESWVVRVRLQPLFKRRCLRGGIKAVSSIGDHEVLELFLNYPLDPSVIIGAFIYCVRHLFISQQVMVNRTCHHVSGIGCHGTVSRTLTSPFALG